MNADEKAGYAIQTWPREQRPNIDEFTAWFHACHQPAQQEILSRLLEAHEVAGRCFLMNHDGMQHALDQTWQWARREMASASRYRSAWRSARRRAQNVATDAHRPPGATNSPNVAGSDHASADGSEDESGPGETVAEVIGRERGML